MLQRQSYYLKLEDYIDCFAEATALDELRRGGMAAEGDEAAIKWLALALLHGLSCRTDALEMSRSANGSVEVRMSGCSLPAPEREFAPQIFEAVRRIAHLEGEDASVPLTLGIRNDSLDFQVEMTRRGGGEFLTIRFPNVGTA
ncbi:MAG: hypothetical protein HY900_04425 [Deltaproteobacteria bacterium]|nr:hypothetical protein [Deltaproteobacteria bacterium]